MASEHEKGCCERFGSKKAHFHDEDLPRPGWGGKKMLKSMCWASRFMDNVHSLGSRVGVGGWSLMVHRWGNGDDKRLMGVKWK